MTNEEAFEEVCLRWSSFGFARYDSQGPNPYTVGYCVPGGGPAGGQRMELRGCSWEEALDDYTSPELITPDNWFDSVASVEWRRRIKELMITEPELDFGYFSAIDQEWLEDRRIEKYTPEDVISDLVGFHGGGI